MRIMGLDFGEKRIGIAFSDPMGWTAQGHSILQRKGLKKDLTHLQSLCEEYQVEKIVLGLPLNMDGTMGPKARETQEFAQAIQEALQIPVEFWDERLSSKSAKRVLLEADLSRKRRKELMDKIAAVHILQAYLDRGYSNTKR